ncbi:hypothetical protein F4805DRAFT_117391 [Annulohypoxylon moriforme]|nr:hypothetical protein F4805DRAFT_117391 [Annulohypoxylon moriforme]
MASGSSIGQPSGSEGGPSGASHHYDSQTGQTYREWTASRPNPSQHVTPWEHEGVISRYRHIHSGKKGARSFVAMLIKVVSQNVHYLDVDYLDDVPTHLVRQLWDELEQTHNQMSLHAFMGCSRHLTINQRKYANHKSLPKTVFKYHRIVKEAVSPLSKFTEPLMYKPFDFIVHLTITGRNAHFETHELLSLTELKNLGVLEIVQPQPSKDASEFPRVNDSVLKVWAESEDPFPLLRVLRIWGEHFTTHRSLEYLDKFPALRVYDVAGRRDDWLDSWDGKGLGPSWKKIKYRWGWSLLRAITEVVEELSTLSIYGDTVKAYGLIEYWKDSFEAPGTQRYYYDPPESRVKMRIGEDEAAKLRETVSAGEDKMETFRDHLRDGDNDENVRRHAWGYILYCHIGRLTGNKDLVNRGMHNPQESFVLEDNLIPPRPYIEVNLGDLENTDDDKDFQCHSVFVRKLEQPPKKRPASDVDSGSSKPPKASSESAPPRKLTKKQRFFDLKDL